MMEAIITLLIALVTFAIGYGHLQAEVRNNRQVSDDRYTHAIKEIDMLKENNDQTKEVLTEIQVSLKGLSSDIHYIKKSLEKLEEKQ